MKKALHDSLTQDSDFLRTDIQMKLRLIIQTIKYWNSFFKILKKLRINWNIRRSYGLGGGAGFIKIEVEEHYQEIAC